MSGEKDRSEKPGEPRVFALRRVGKSWRAGRRSFLKSAGAAALLAGSAGARKATAQDIRGGKKKGDPFGFCNQAKAHAKDIIGIAFKADGSLLATCSRDGTVKIWDLSTGSLARQLDVGQTVDARAVAFTPNGKYLLVALKSGGIGLWQLSKKKMTFKRFFSATPFPDLEKNIGGEDFEGLAVTPDGSEAIVGLYGGAVLFYSIPGGDLLRSWLIDNPLDALALSRDGKMLATGRSRYSERAVVTLWSLEAGSEGTRIRDISLAPVRAVYLLAFSPNGQYVVTSDGYTRIWAVADGALIKQLSGTYSVSALAVCPDGLFFAHGENNRTARVYSLPGGNLKKELGDVADGNWTSAKALAFSPDGETLAAGYANVEGHGASLRLWDHKSGRLLRCFIDLAATEKTSRGITYKYRGKRGEWVAVTAPNCQCAPSPPDDAVCSCNTVKGECSCVGYTCSCVGYVCSCQGHCSCQGYGHYWWPN